MIFTAELQIAHDNGNLGTGGTKNDQDGQQESHDVVNLVQPKGTHDEGQLDADTSERQNTAKDGRDERMHVPWKFGDDTGNLVGLGGDFQFFGTESKVGTNKDERCTNAAPKSKESHNGEEGSGRGGTSHAQKDVEDTKDGHKSTGQSDGGVERVLLPRLGITELVETSRGVSSDTSAEDIDQEECAEGLTLLEGVQELEDGKDHGDEEGRSNLCTSSDKDAEEHRRHLGRTEDVSVDELPSGFFLGFFEGLHFIVSGNILAEGTDHDGGNGSRQEENDHE
mmetsp:Transcript_5834/g.10198  ORF Transcript_5834/g.10198 Transcript_5834/m.10198 type:complete len:281 (-) Transcript_5834:127-969(-)